ncbi:hypothetical protein Bbelb_385240 [Branchiostoma belcheri]|nr:hypothetical protein Bbelb_385240 [Branchiostoma belcheri]
MLVLLLAVCGVLPLVSGWTTDQTTDQTTDYTTDAIPTTMSTPSGPVDWRPCGDFPWDTNNVTVSCDYTYTDVKQWIGWSSSSEPPLVLHGQCNVTCPPEADMLVGPPYSERHNGGYGVTDGAYYCNVGNSTWMGSEPVCLGHYDNSIVITGDTNRVRLVGGEFYGCVELYDDVTGQWGPVRGWDVSYRLTHHEARMSWVDLACRNLGFREGLATAAYELSNGVVISSWAKDILQSHYHPSYPSNIPKFMVNQTFSQWEGATLHDAIDRVERGDYCPTNSWSCNRDYMCLACAGERTQGGSQDPRPCGDFPWDTDDVTVSCDYTYSDVKTTWSQDPLVLHGRCTVTCPPEADMLVGPPYSDDSYGYGVHDGAYYCNVGNSTWMGSEPVCLGRYDNSTVITDDTNRTRLVGGEFYGCVEMYDGVTGLWGPVMGWDISYEWASHWEDRMSWADLACRDLGFREGLATNAYMLSNGVVSSEWAMYPLQSHYRPSYPSPVPKFSVSWSLPWEGSSLRAAIDHVDRWGGYSYTDDAMCLACAGERTLDRPQDPKPCGDFPWDTDDVTVSCDYTYTDVSPWGDGYGSTVAPIFLQGRCTVTCPPEADMLVGPSDDDYYPSNLRDDGAYTCNVGNKTWIGSEPVCLGHYDNSTVITDDTNGIRLVGGEFYGCVELYDDDTGQWGPVKGRSPFEKDRMSWADLACRDLGFRKGLATNAYTLTNGFVHGGWLEPLQGHYRPSYPSTVPKFMVNWFLPLWQGATLRDAIEQVIRGPCPYNDEDCWRDHGTMCLACVAEQTQDGSQDIAAEVTCTSDHLEVSFPRPPDNSVQAADVQLAAPPCRAEQNSTHIYIRTHFEKCGTSTESLLYSPAPKLSTCPSSGGQGFQVLLGAGFRQERADQEVPHGLILPTTTPSELIYRNTLTVGADPSSNGITWYRVPKILLECRLPRNKTLSLHFRPHLNSVFRSHVQGEGEFEISMQLFRTDKFWQPVTEYPVYVDLRQSVRNKTAELATVVDTYKPDIVAGTESWLNQNIASSEIFPSNYIAHRKDRQTGQGGGVFQANRDDLIVTHRPDLDTDCEVLWTQTQLAGRKPLIIGTYYRPPSDQGNSLDELDRSIGKMGAKINSDNVIILGDFNTPGIKWDTTVADNSQAYTGQAEKLLNLMDNHGLFQTVQEPTRNGNLLDLVLVNNPNIIEKTTVVPGISDHDMVLVDVNLALKQNRKPKRKVYIRTKADEPAIKKDLTDYATNFHKRTQDMSVTQKWSEFKDKMKDTMNKHIPSKITSSRYNLPWFNRNLRRHCRKKQRLYNKAKKTGQEEDWNKYKRVKKGVQKSIRQAHSKYVADILGEAIVDKPKTFWSYIKGLRKDLVGVAPLKVGNTIISDSGKKAEVLSSQFKSVFTEEDTTDMPSLGQPCTPPMEHIVVSTDGVEKMLQGLNPSKASGPDQIPPWFLKLTASEIAPVLTNIFQHSLNTAEIPKDWRDANICAIFKKGDRAVPSNYRPVSLTCISCKLLEHIIHSQIMKHLESYSILTDYQHGFRAKRSTETQLILTVHDIAGALNSKRQVDLAILDFTKAFDKVPHGRLISKLEYYGIQGPTLNWLKAFLTNREQTVVVEGKASAPVKVASGVPQGTVLGPLLFLLYINDLPDQLDSNVRLFADDCLLYVELSTQTDSQLLQKDLNTLEEWQSKWLMQFNPEKCYIMHITNKRTPHATSYQFCGQALATTKIHPYLGVTLTSGLKWGAHMIHVQIQVISNGTDLQVFPHTCVATPSDDPSDTTRNYVIVDGCAKLPTLQFYPSPGPDRGRFGFQAFAYTSGVPTVYLHCDVLLYFQARVPSPNSGRQDLVTASSILGACAVLAAAMFVLGVLYKARREGRQSGYRVLENAE